MTLDIRPALQPWGVEALQVYMVTDRALTAGRPLDEVVRAAVAGGAGCVQLREKHLSTRDFVAQARALRPLLAACHVPLVINDRIDVALACGADGVHLGQDDMPAEDARRLLASTMFIGWSVETLEQVRQAEQLPVDYLGISPVFATPTKTDTAPPWGLEGLRHARAGSRLPLVAIGGIHEHNAASVIAHGADGVAVVRALCAADDPRQAASRLLGAVQAACHGPPSSA